MRILITKWMVRFARKQRIADSSLREAIARAERGLVDADLGGGLIKQRVARSGQGRSGGYRMIVAYREGNRAPDELLTLREIGAAWLAADDAMLAKALRDGTVQEVGE